MNRIQIVYKPIGDVFPDEMNPRRNDDAVPAVKESIRQFGFKIPMVITPAGMIVAGHTRYKAAKELGLEKVPCVIAEGLTPVQLRAFQLADNKTGELAVWDSDLLNMELDSVAGVFDMAALGFQKKVAEEKKKKDAKADKDPAVVICPRCGQAIRKVHAFDMDAEEGPLYE